MGWIDEINLIVAMVDQKNLKTKFSLEAFHFGSTISGVDIEISLSIPIPDFTFKLKKQRSPLLQ